MRPKFRSIIKWGFGVLLVLALLSYVLFFYPFLGIPFNGQRQGNPPLTPAWALECWLWEDDVNTAEYVDELLAGYAEHDIPVRTIIIDSPWSLRYNDFEVDTLRYPESEKWFGRLQNDGYRVVLWLTSMVNESSKDTHITNSKIWFDSIAEKGYVIGGSKPNKWWKGKGGFLDYTHPEARQWWHAKQQPLLDWGIDGWKLDGAATLFWTELGPLPLFYKKSHQGIISTRKYMNLYYRKEYENGLKSSPDFVTLSRSMDRGYHPEGFAPIDASPVNWVGDQEHQWKGSGEGDAKDKALDGVQGFEAAIKSILRSAKKGYSVIGSDVAGFSGGTIPPRLYMRWAQFSAFCGLFMNGGHGERRLWKRSQEELKVIRKFSWLHTELVPYMYHYVHTAHTGGRRLQTPLENGDYHYMFGEDFLVAPIYVDDTFREVSLPEGQWRYLFDDAALLGGNQNIKKDYPMDEFPVYVREGAIIPMNVSRDYTGFGDKASEGFRTYLMYPKAGTHRFTDYKEHGGSTEISYRLDNDELEVHMQGGISPHILRWHSAKPPKNIRMNGQFLDVSEWEYLSEAQKVVVKTCGQHQALRYLIQY
ncbi:TIM-barrel domain-containing protein [Sediminicola luteus]|uniref:Glycoside hydrolase n=1 Tax=Sediminicola luteus TaxID=319238 RepID=A0A2A4GAQ7_9FLAO|nr:TIM-barrel domain-containing protein [Sediminicola luteus]PCE65060.1 glycoside hydrolase [Sediminicola luteus]